MAFIPVPSAADSATILALLSSDHTPVAEKVQLMNGLHPALTGLFNKVAPKDNWKGPINALVTLSADELALLPYAIEFFTATKATILRGSNPGTYVVTADGYAAGPAGDH